MPRILQMFQTADGRMAVVLDVPPVQGVPASVTLWTEEERTKAIRLAILSEREECAKFVEPSAPRPCDCQRCDCGNADDAQRTAEWDIATALASSIRNRPATI